MISSQNLVEHEEPLLSLKKFINYFTPPLPEDLSLGGKFIFHRSLLDGPEELTTQFPQIILEEMQLPNDILSVTLSLKKKTNILTV